MDNNSENKILEDGYYLLSLTNMDIFSDYYGDFDRLPTGCFPGIVYEKIETNEECDAYYARMPIVGKQVRGIMYDFVSGTKISNQISRGLQYIEAAKIPSEMVNALFKELTDDDIKRYITALSTLYIESVKRYDKLKSNEVVKNIK